MIGASYAGFYWNFCPLYEDDLDINLVRGATRGRHCMSCSRLVIESGTGHNIKNANDKPPKKGTCNPAFGR